MTTASPDAPRRPVPRTDRRVNTVRLDRDRRIAYAEYGDPEGTPVVFLHGTPGSRRLGELFDGAAREHGVRLLAPDRPGYGQSPAWPDRSISDAGRFVAAVLDDANVRTTSLVAFSGGAPHALATAATHPDRIARVDVVSGATPPAVSDETPAVQRLLAGMATTVPAVLGGLLRGQAWLADRLDPSFVVSQYTADGRAASVPDDAAATVGADFVEAFAGGATGAVTEFRNAATDWDVPYEGIESDVRFHHGDADTNVPVEGVRRLVGLIPGARIETVEDADHLQTLLRTVPDLLADHGRGDR